MTKISEKKDYIIAEKDNIDVLIDRVVNVNHNYIYYIDC